MTTTYREEFARLSAAYGRGESVTPSALDMAARLAATEQEDAFRASARYAPAGTTPAGGGPLGHCDVCGRRDCDWNPGAGAHLCDRHWDEY